MTIILKLDINGGSRIRDFHLCMSLQIEFYIALIEQLTVWKIRSNDGSHHIYGILLIYTPMRTVNAKAVAWEWEALDNILQCLTIIHASLLDVHRKCLEHRRLQKQGKPCPFCILSHAILSLMQRTGSSRQWCIRICSTVARRVEYKQWITGCSRSLAVIASVKFYT